YAFWSRDVPNGLRHSSWRARPCPRGTRLRVPLGAGAHAHSGEPSKPVAWRSQPAEGILARLRPIPRAHRGRDGDIAPAPRHGNLPHRRARSDPKPVQKPRPPVRMGGGGPTTFDRVVEFADGWMPLARSGRNPAEKICLLRQRAEKAGRDPKSISVTIFFAKPEKVALEGLRAAGVERAIFGVPSEGRDTVLPLLDSYTRVMV